MVMYGRSINRWSIICCRYTRKNHFPGWARPFEFNANLYSSIGRNEEARDGVSASVLALLH